MRNETDAPADKAANRRAPRLELELYRAVAEIKCFARADVPGQKTLARRVENHLIGKEGFRNSRSIRMIGDDSRLLGNFRDLEFLFLLAAADGLADAKEHPL